MPIPITESVTDSPSSVDNTAIDSFVEEMMAEKQIPGLSLAIIQDQKLIKTKGYGLLNRELNVKVRPSSIFPIASMSKPLTATAIMLLVQDGKLDLDAPVSDYLANVPEAWEAVTVRRMLNHTAGLSEDIYQGNLNRLIEPNGFVEAAALVPLDFQPGESWMYSNTGFNLAADVVESVSGEPFETFMETRIFEPLGMRATDVVRESYRSSNLAMGYWAGRRAIQPIDINFGWVRKHMLLIKGAGSVTSNAVDLARWALFLQKGAGDGPTGQLLSADSQADMRELGTTNSGLTTGYGLGWFVGGVNSHTMVTHGGNLWGYSTSISQFPDDQLTVVVLTNKDGESGDAIARKIAEKYIPSLKFDLEKDAIADQNPTLTASLLAYLQGDDAAITPTPEREIALRQTTRGQYIAERWQNYRRSHSITSLALLAQSSHPNGTLYRYRAAKGDSSDSSEIFTVTVTDNGLVATMGFGVSSF